MILWRGEHHATTLRFEDITKEGAPEPAQRILCAKHPETESLGDRGGMQRAGDKLSTVSEHISFLSGNKTSFILEPIMSDSDCFIQQVQVWKCLISGVGTERHTPLPPSPVQEVLLDQ